MHRVLIVARNFAPVSHVSSERVTKLVKYLPEFGWESTVLTGHRGTAGLPSDPSLLDQVAGAEVLRARAPELSLFYRTGRASGRDGAERATAVRDVSRAGKLNPKSWLIPDPQIFWLPFAVERALAASSRRRWSVVLATTSPPTAALIGHVVARRLGIPLVIDFRDAWTGYYAAPRRPAPLAALERRLEAHIVRSAAAITRVSGTYLQALIHRLDARRLPPVHEIPNGYDDDDFTGVVPAALPRFSIVHTGQLRRTLQPLWRSLAVLQEREPTLRGAIHFWQVGWVDRTAAPYLEAPPDGVTVHRVPPVPVREAIAYMLGADLLFIEGMVRTLSAKTYQYLRSGRPILAITGEAPALAAELRSVVETTPMGRALAHDETEAAAEFIRAVALAPRGEPAPPGTAIARYSRREIARAMAGVLDAAVGRPRPS